VRWAIDGFGTFKAAGEDGIFPGPLQHGIEIIIGHITKNLVLTLHRWIDVMLRCRSDRVEIRQNCARVLVNRGWPHGGVLSPLLWNMVEDGLLRRLHNAHYQAQGYADDVVLLQKGKVRM
jgi:hypothetical protein